MLALLTVLNVYGYAHFVIGNAASGPHSEMNEPSLFGGRELLRSDCSVGSSTCFGPSLPNQVDTYAAQSHPKDRHPAHYRSPERHGLLSCQIILAALMLACGVVYFIRAIIKGLAGQTRTFGRDIALGIFGIVCGVASSIVVNFSLGYQG